MRRFCQSTTAMGDFMANDGKEPQKKWPDEVIQLLRTTQQHHVQLSLMADHKANMLIGATFVVFTLAIGQSHASNFSLPLLILAISAFCAAGLAALAVMPATKIRAGANPNVLFFGAFSKMTEEEFKESLLSNNFSSQENIYRTMMRDIYQMGVVLERKKYRYLGWAYRIFLLGLSLTFVTFLFEQLSGPIL
jgi:hypothetical protein